MRLVLISDTHEAHRRVKVPDGDILIHAGDITYDGNLREVKDFNNWLGELPHKHKVLIAGNHDWSFEESPVVAERLITNATYLRDSSIEIDGLRIYGAPWQPTFCNWAFNVDRGAPIREKWAKIPENTDVLVTHGPPKGFGDRAYPTGEMLGCLDLYERVQQVKPMLHVFGHIHGGYGIQEDEHTIYTNAAIMNEAYRPVNAPLVIDLKQK
jgi:Icc-related predicted phosphoesterase